MYGSIVILFFLFFVYLAETEQEYDADFMLDPPSSDSPTGSQRLRSLIG